MRCHIYGDEMPCRIDIIAASNYEMTGNRVEAMDLSLKVLGYYNDIFSPKLCTIVYSIQHVQWDTKDTFIKSQQF